MDVTPQIRVESERKVTVGDLVQMADAMWKIIRDAKVPAGDHAGQDRLITRMQRDNPQFCMAYPVVVKYACYMHLYDTTTFRLWLERIQRSPWTNESTYLDAMADYVTSLVTRSSRGRGKRINTAERDALRKNTRAMLQTEHDQIKKCAQTAEAEVLAEEAKHRALGQRDLADFSRIAGPTGMAPAGTFRVDTGDLASAPPAPIDVALVEPLGDEFEL